MSSTYFQYEDKYYQQKEGTAMGSPISAIVAELCLEMLELECVHNNRQIKFWKRFVDDIFAIARRRNIKQIHDKINSFHPAIQFTIELEVDEKIPFLDIMLYNKKDGTIGFHVFRKPTQTNKYLHYDSFHPNAHKISVCDTLLSRALKLCDEDHQEEEIEVVKKILTKNGYPISMIDNRLKLTKQKLIMPTMKKEIEKRVILPWAGNTTTKMAQFIRRKLSWEIGYYPGQKISSLLCNLKQKPFKSRKGVYEFKCENCDDKYIGETGRDINIRFIEHQNDVKRSNIKSPVFLHMIENEHNIDLNSLKMMFPESRKFHRKFKEGLSIRNTSNNMNSSRGMNINPIWSSTLINFLKFDPVT